MKIIGFIFILLCGISFGQDLEKIQKKYGVEECAESDYLIVFRKGKSGIYDKKKQEFVIVPTESSFIYLDKFEILFEFTQTNKVIVRDLFSENFPSSFIESGGENYFSFQNGTYYENRKGDYYLSKGKMRSENSKTGKIAVIEDSTAILSSKLQAIPSHVQYTFGVEKKDEFVIITDLRNDSYNNNPIALESLEYPGEDSIDVNGYTVYPDENYAGYQHTGVFDLRSRKWIIEPEYFRILSLNDFIFCNKQDSFNGEIFFPGYGHWDIFKIEDGQIIQVKNDVSWSSEIPLDEIFEADGFNFVQKDSSYVEFQKNGKNGLLRFSLFYNTDYLYADQPAYASVSLYFDTLLHADYDLIANIGSGLIEPDYMLLNEEGITYASFNANRIIKNVSAKRKLSIRDYGQSGRDWSDFTYWIIDNQTFKTKNNDSLTFFSKMTENPIEKRLLSRRSMEILNDSLVYVEYWIKQGTYWEPVYGDDYYEPTVNEDGNELFYPPDPGEFKSGIFNLNADSWLYDREYAWLTRSHDNFQICYPDLDSVGYYTTYLFKIDDFDLQEIEREEKPDELKMSFKDRLPNYDTDTIYSILGGTPSYFGYFELENKMGLYYKGYPEILLNPREYTYFNDDYNFHCSFKEDNCLINMVCFDSLFSLADFNKLTILPAHNMPPNGGDLFIQIENQTDHHVIHIKDEENYAELPFTKEDFEAYYHQEIGHLNWHFSIHKMNDSLLYIEDWLADEKQTDVYPLTSLEYPGEDSLDENGDWVYPALFGGYNRSGIYNLNSKTWFLDKIYYKIEMAEGQFLLRKAVRKEDGLIDSYPLEIINLKKEVIWDGKDYNELPDESPFFKILVDD